MRLRIFFVLLVATVSILAPPLWSAEPDSPVRAELLADADQLRPGASFRLGVHLKMEPGWHVYWVNPGEAGLATSVEYAAASSYQIGPVQWPVPITFEEPGSITSYGYGDGVVLISNVDTASTPPGATTTVRARTSWLACKARCVLGSSDLELELPVPAAAAAEARELFDHWQQRLPAAGTGTEPFSLRILGPGQTADTHTELTLWLRWLHPPTRVEWFPNPPDRLKVTVQRVETRNDLTRIDLLVAAGGGDRQPLPDLPSLVVTTDQEGRRVGHPLAVPLSEHRP